MSSEDSLDDIVDSIDEGDGSEASAGPRADAPAKEESPETKESRDAQAFFMQEEYNAESAQVAAEGGAEEVGFDVSSGGVESAGPITDEDIAAIEALIGASGGGNGAEKSKSDAPPRQDSPVHITRGEAEEVLKGAMPSVEESPAEEVAPIEAPDAGADESAGLFDDDSGGAKAEHDMIIAAGKRLENIAGGSSFDPSFDDVEDALAQPYKVEDRGAGESADNNKTEIELRPRHERLAARKVAAKSSPVGEETGDFTDGAAQGGAIAPADLRLGDEIAGTYIVKKRLSSGGMGALYAARDKGLDRDVAIKVILNNGTPLTDEQVERFRAEAYAMAKVAHEGLAQVYGAGTWQGTPYLVMELCQGGDLLNQMRERGVPSSGRREQTTKTKVGSSSKNVVGAQLVEALRQTARSVTSRLRRLPLEEVVVAADVPTSEEASAAPIDSNWTIEAHASLIKKLAGALAVVHEKGVVHRDLKPANVMYVDKGMARPVVIDFGLVPVKNEQEGAVLGTPSYMSPEQALADKNLDFRTDIYSLGTVFYELVTGKIPYQESSKPKNVVETLKRIIEEPLTPPLQLNKAIHPELSAIIEKMLAKELLIDRSAIKRRVDAELEWKPELASMDEVEKRALFEKTFKREYDKEYTERRKSAEGPFYRYESMDEVITDIDRWEKGLPVMAMTYTDAERKAKELKYWEKMNPEEARLKREEEARALQWKRNKRRAGIGAAALVALWAGYRVNEWQYGKNAQFTVNETRASVASIAERARRDGVAGISTDLAATIARVSSAESLVSEWVVRQRTADAAQGQVQIQEDRRTVDSIQESLRKYNDARVLLAEYERARGESDFARAYQAVFSAYQLSGEAVAEVAGARGLDDARARALVTEVERLRDDAISRRINYSRERIDAYESRMKALYKARFLRQIPGGQEEFARETERARADLARELDNPAEIDLRRVAVTPEMRANWSRLEREALRGAEELEAELRSVPGLEQGIILGARAEQHRSWVEYVNTVQRRINVDEARQFFDEIRAEYRALRQDASLSDEQYLERGAKIRARIDAYERGASGPTPRTETPKSRRRSG